MHARETRRETVSANRTQSGHATSVPLAIVPHCRFRTRVFLTLLLGLLLQANTLQGAEEASEADFCIHTQVFDAGADRPIADNLTVFHGGKIYDFQQLGAPSVSVFDVEGRRFLLARPDRSVQTTVSADELVRFAAQEHPKALKSPSELVRFAAEPKFQEKYDRRSGRLILSSDVFEYEIESASVDDPNLVQRYVQFANWYAYLNSMFSPLPPAVRLELNQAFDRHATLPKRVERRLKENGEVIRSLTMVSKHELVHGLTPAAKQALADWQSKQPALQYIDLTSYRQLQTELSAARSSSNTK